MKVHAPTLYARSDQERNSGAFVLPQTEILEVESRLAPWRTDKRKTDILSLLHGCGETNTLTIVARLGGT